MGNHSKNGSSIFNKIVIFAIFYTCQYYQKIQIFVRIIFGKTIKKNVTIFKKTGCKNVTKVVQDLLTFAPSFSYNHRHTGRKKRSE